jgi:hypothetical protein
VAALIEPAKATRSLAFWPCASLGARNAAAVQALPSATSGVIQ